MPSPNGFPGLAVSFTVFILTNLQISSVIEVKFSCTKCFAFMYIHSYALYILINILLPHFFYNNMPLELSQAALPLVDFLLLL